MATIEKLKNELERTRAKITEQQKRVRELELKIAEEENLEIVRMVKAVKLERPELAAFLKAYASGEISLPAKEDIQEQEDNEDEE